MEKIPIKSSIRKSVTVVILLFSVLLTFFIYIISTEVILKSYEQIEKDVVSVNVDRMDFTVEYLKKNQSTKLKDWSVWDDTYYFLQNSNEEYIENNLSVEGLVNIDINFMIFVDSETNIIYTKLVDLNTLSEINAEGISNFFQTQKNIIKHSSIDSFVSGLIETPNGLAIISSAPVLKNDGSGPIAGSLVFGNFINKDTLGDLDGFFLSPIDVFEYDDILPSDVILAREDFVKLNTNKYIKDLSKNDIAGYFLANDLNNKPVAIFRVLVDRDFYNQGLNSFIIFTVISGLLFLLFGLSILFVLEKKVLSKIIKLNNDISNIKNEEKAEKRLDVLDEDEFGQLSSSINEMLNKIYLSQEKEKKLINQEKMAVLSLKNHVDTTDKLNKLMVKRELKMIELKKEIEKLKKSNI